eukprot:CAMPEP_0206160662 /NCGR_PEP_ID=MMETSP1474-20131121/6976_1 /ASSEMBLY_ACC=CAM_ASM_001110 /TAXON_ID=97495 /ORGANISM="Imantonia sp., Strain RCC918" /LENGTH=198 /DNA_ID=CAMNT_0053562135 /DNA_START=15 /DNA_END=608 /DNA_ORIENTATION=+
MTDTMMLPLVTSVLLGWAPGLRRCSVPSMQMPSMAELTVDRVRAYTKPSEMLEHLQSMTDTADGLQLSRLLAVAHSANNEPLAAEAHARAVLEQEPSDVDMRFVVGVACEHRDEQEEALDAYEAVLDADPDYWRALFHVGKISLQVGWVADAKEYFERALAIEPTHLATIEIVQRLRQIEVAEDDAIEAEAGKEAGKE